MEYENLVFNEANFVITSSFAYFLRHPVSLRLLGVLCSYYRLIYLLDVGRWVHVYGLQHRRREVLFYEFGPMGIS